MQTGPEIFTHHISFQGNIRSQKFDFGFHQPKFVMLRHEMNSGWFAVVVKLCMMHDAALVKIDPTLRFHPKQEVSITRCWCGHWCCKSGKIPVIWHHKIHICTQVFANKKRHILYLYGLILATKMNPTNLLMAESHLPPEVLLFQIQWFVIYPICLFPKTNNLYRLTERSCTHFGHPKLPHRERISLPTCDRRLVTAVL